MAKHRSHSIQFKRQVAQEFIAGETLHALSSRHDVSRNLIRIWVRKFESGAFDDDAQAADLLQDYEAKIAALERMVGRQALEIESGQQFDEVQLFLRKVVDPPLPIAPVERRLGAWRWFLAELPVDLVDHAKIVDGRLRHHGRLRHRVVHQQIKEMIAGFRKLARHRAPVMQQVVRTRKEEIAVGVDVLVMR